MSKFALVVVLTSVFAIDLMQPPAAQAQEPKQRQPGTSTVCGDYLVLIPIILPGPVPVPIMFNRPDEGWAYIDRTRKRRQATGIAFDIQVASNDTPANHYSHDLDFKIRLDRDQEDLLSDANGDALPVEWETGIRPEEKSSDGANPIFPKWAWPGQNDRVWVDGNWIYDCGHPDEDTGLYQAELHPARAVATMRERTATLPGTGLTPVPATQTDLYISGNGGYAPNQLNCGLDIILGFNGDTCGEDEPPADESYKTTPINDTDFSFFMCLPPRPTPAAVLSHVIAYGPGNTVALQPDVVPVATSGYCVDPGYDATTMLSVTVRLNGTTTPPTAVYARRIFAGWLVPPDPVLPHRRVTLTKTDLHEDHDGDPGDGELSFWWMNVNLAEAGWMRLSDHANGNMNDYDDDFPPVVGGDGEMRFTGASKDFYMRPDQPVTLESQGFEQDCFDNAFAPFPDGFWFTQRHLWVIMYFTCYSDVFDKGAGDTLGRTRVSFDADDLGDHTISDSDQYDLYVTIDEIEIDLEDESHLSIHPECTPDDEVALVGHELTCATDVHNAGTGLPRKVEITNQFSGPPAPIVNSSTWSIPGPLGTPATDCVVGADALCRPVTVLVALKTPVAMRTVVTPTAPGMLTTRAEVTTASEDPDLTNNVKSTTIEVFRGVTIDISPDDDQNVINMNRRSLTVAILGAADFDATTISPLSVCFGDAEAPTERSCAERHGEGHLQDVNNDQRLDMVLHFFLDETGIDLGDSKACAKGRLQDGVGIFGCAAVVTQ